MKQLLKCFLLWRSYTFPVKTGSRQQRRLYVTPPRTGSSERTQSDQRMQSWSGFLGRFGTWQPGLSQQERLTEPCAYFSAKATAVCLPGISMNHLPALIVLPPSFSEAARVWRRSLRGRWLSARLLEATLAKSEAICPEWLKAERQKKQSFKNQFQPNLWIKRCFCTEIVRSGHLQQTPLPTLLFLYIHCCIMK